MESSSPENSLAVFQQADHAQHDAMVRGEMEILLASRSLRDSDNLKRFLRYVVEHTLTGEADQLKEYRLGVEVFGRDSSFDPKIDPVVRMAARRLRSKLQDYYDKEGKKARLRIAVPKGGYAVSFVPSAESSAFAGERAAPLIEEPPLSSTRPIWTLAVALVLLAAAAITALRFWTPKTSSGTLPPASLAVLPFLNLTGNPDNDYLSDGVTDEITGSLAKSAGLRVVARTSAFQFKGKSLTCARLAGN